MSSRFVLTIVVALVGIAPSIGDADVEYFVATNGRDSNPGTQQSPFQTLSRARVEVRKQVAGGLTQPVTVFLRQGTYQLNEPLVFGPQDSGTEQLAICFAAFSGEVVVISGGRPVDGWQQQQNGHWIAELPEVRDGNWFFRQLIVNDRRAIRARWPNGDGKLHIETVDDAVRQFTFDKPLLSVNLAAQDAEMVVYQNWSVTRGLIQNSDRQHLTTATPMGWIGHGPMTTASRGKTVFLEHAECFLDQPGEWFLDRTRGLLHYVPDGLFDPQKTPVVAPRLKQLLVIAGTRANPVRNLHFRGIRFENADFALPQIGYNEIQAAHYGTTLTAATYVQPVAIECAYAQACRFEKCRFAHLNSSAIGFGPGCRRNHVEGCTIEDIGGTGVMIGWRGKGVLKNGVEGKLDADWLDPADAPAENVVSNCQIRRCGADSFGATAVFVAFSRDTRISHNQIHDLPYSGVSVGYRWNTSATTQTRCIVEYNHIFDVMKKLADGGGIYTLGRQPGTIFRGNHIHHVQRSHFAHGGAPNNGFFVDEGSSGFLFEMNVVHSTSGQAVRFNNCQKQWHGWKSNQFGNQVASSEQAQRIIEQAGLEGPFRDPK